MIIIMMVIILIMIWQFPFCLWTRILGRANRNLKFITFRTLLQNIPKNWPLRDDFLAQSLIYDIGTDFFCCSKMAVTRRRSKLWWRLSHQSKALDISYLSSLSKRDLKPSGTFFSKICMRPWIRRYLFFFDFCPRRATKVWSLQKYVWNVLLMILKCCLMILKCCVYVFESLFNQFEIDFYDLSNSSEKFGSEKNYKGGRDALAPRPLCRFFSDPTLFRLVLKSRICSFQSILACRGES